MIMDSLRVLVWSNPLVVDKISHKFRYQADSGFIFTRHLLKGLPTNWRFTWVIPDKIPEEEYGWFQETHPNVHLLPYPYATNIHQNRYEFHGNVLRKTFQYGHDIDVILNNQPEVSANLKVWANNQRRESPVILSFYHWLDVPESAQFGQALSGYFWRQWDGWLASDSAFFHNIYAFELFMTAVREHVNLKGADMFQTKMGIFNPPATEFGNTRISMPDEKVVMFNHRLNGTTQWKKVVETMDTLWQERKDFVLWLTDADGYSRNKKYLSKYPFIRLERIPEDSYGYVLKNSHMAVCAHRGYSTWNMAILDSIRNGLFTLIPADGVYLDMLDKFLYKLPNMWHTYDDLYHKIKTLLDTPQDELDEQNEQVLGYVKAEYSGTSTEIEKQITEHIINKMGKKPPKKYDEVFRYILSEGRPVDKREWVNEFWSFHVNSNFQKLRWWLLQEAMLCDDTEKEMPTYSAFY